MNEKLKSLSDAASHKDPKTLLQEHLQSHAFAITSLYRRSIEGSAHQQQFTMSCRFTVSEHKTLAKVQVDVERNKMRRVPCLRY